MTGPTLTFPWFTDQFTDIGVRANFPSLYPLVSPSSSYKLNELLAPAKICTFSIAGLSIPPQVTLGPKGIIAPALAYTGISSKSPYTICQPPPWTYSPEKKLNQSPSGNQIRWRANPVTGSCGVVNGAATSSLPNQYSCQIHSYAPSCSGHV